MAKNTAQMKLKPVIAKSSLYCIHGSANPIASDSLDSSDIGKSDWEKLLKISEDPVEKAKFTAGLVTIVDRVMTKPKNRYEKFLSEVDLEWLLLSGEARWSIQFGPVKGRTPYEYAVEYGFSLNGGVYI
jgi:hypothetical protein